MKRGLKWEGCDWTNSYALLADKALDIPVQHVELHPANFENAQCGLKVKAGGCQRVLGFAARLRQQAPKRSVNEVREHMLFLLILLGLGIGLFLFHRHRHAEGDPLLTLFHITAQLLPTLVGVERTRNEVALKALR